MTSHNAADFEVTKSESFRRLAAKPDKFFVDLQASYSEFPEYARDTDTDGFVVTVQRGGVLAPP